MKKSELERLVQYYESEFENIRRVVSCAENHRSDSDTLSILLGLVGGISSKENLERNADFSIRYPFASLHVIEPEKYWD